MSGRSAGLLILLIAAASAGVLWQRLLAYLRYFQQEGYEHRRYLRWVGVRFLTDPALYLALAAALLSTRARLLAGLLFIAGAALLAWLQPNPRRSGKIPLRMTWRARRILGLAAIVAAAAWLMLFALLGRGVPPALLASTILIAAVPFTLVAANALLTPYERSAQRRFEADAVRQVEIVRPFIVGITGSYGKSSTKAILAHVLQFEGPTLAATGSINTLMGITRHIRENLVHGHQFMVVEMGAFKTGSIARLCQLTPPSAGLITAVGDMHLERFGSLDEIVRAKSELAAAIPPGGLLVVNADSPGALRIARGAVHARVLLYGEHSADDLETRLEQVQVSRRGTSFVLRTRTGAHECFTPLHGRPIILNLAGAFTLAAALGQPPDLIIASLRTLRPVSNRLEVIEEAGVTWIRDAYNSNQFGFRAALEVAAALPASRRYLATPGVIELGAEQHGVNRALAREAAAVCDATLVVSETNRDAFTAGFHDAGRDAQLVAVATRTEAFRWLRETVQAGDLIILENDLPDLYERHEGLFF
jgi:UDP-N-acetylmuramoyl-tripeptide--D-alanyl-D-alanine ligase